MRAVLQDGPLNGREFKEQYEQLHRAQFNVLNYGHPSLADLFSELPSVEVTADGKFGLRGAPSSRNPSCPKRSKLQSNRGN